MSAGAEELDLCRQRGDTFPFEFTIKDSAAAVVDITGATFLMTVDPEPDPTGPGNNLFQLTGVITDAVNGVLTFTPSAANMDQTPDVYFYDVQLTDLAGAIRTTNKGKFEILPDITK